jgi:hypothetical protein
MLLLLPGGRGEDELHFGDDDESIITMIVLQLLLRVDDGELFNDDLGKE